MKQSIRTLIFGAVAITAATLAPVPGASSPTPPVCSHVWQTCFGQFTPEGDPYEACYNFSTGCCKAEIYFGNCNPGGAGMACQSAPWNAGPEPGKVCPVNCDYSHSQSCADSAPH